MSTLVALSVGCARSWVAAYTLGLPAALRETRRSEIDSDLWEQQWLASRRGDPALGTAIEVLGRTLLGILSDITWRAQAGARTRTDRSTRMHEPLYMRGLVLAGIAAALLIVIGGGGAIFNAWEDGDDEGWVVGGIISVISGLAIIAGLLISRRSPTVGVGLVAAGAISIAVLWHWLLVFTVPIGIGLVAIAYFRGRQGGGSSGRSDDGGSSNLKSRWKALLGLSDSP